MKTLVYIKKPSTHKKNLLSDKLEETLGENQENVFVEDIDSISEIDSQILVSNVLNQSILDKLPSLKYLIVPTSGLDGVDLDLINSRNINMYHNPKIFSEEVVRSLTPHLLGIENKKIGLYGFGNIGKTIYSLLSSSNNSFYVYRKNLNFEISNDKNIVYEGNSLEEVIKNSEVHIVSLPKNSETINLFSEKEFTLFKRESQLISISRKEIINEQSFIEAINNKIFSRVFLESYYNSFLDISQKNTCLTLNEHSLGVNSYSIEKMNEWISNKIKELSN